MLEDVTDIILNIKSVIVAVDGDAPRKMRVERSKKGPVLAGDFECEPDVEVYNKDCLIATLTDNVAFSVELSVARGRGYAPAVEHLSEETELGLITVDSLYSPVTRVRYRTEDTRVGQKTNYDRLIMEIWTKGTVAPEDALVEAAKILRKHLNPFVQYYEIGARMAAADASADPEPGAPLDEEMRSKLDIPLSSLNLSVRASNCLESAKIITIGDLLSVSETDLLQLRSFGATSLDEVKIKLSERGFTLGMPPDDAAPTTDPPAPPLVTPTP